MILQVSVTVFAPHFRRVRRASYLGELLLLRSSNPYCRRNFHFCMRPSNIPLELLPLLCHPQKIKDTESESLCAVLYVVF